MNYSKRHNLPNTCYDYNEVSKTFGDMLYNQPPSNYNISNEMMSHDHSYRRPIDNNDPMLPEATKGQLSTYQKEINLLQNKLSISQSDFNHQLAAQDDIIKSYQAKNKQLNDALALKERKLTELLSIVAEYDSQSTTQKNKISILEKENKSLRSIANDMSSNYNKVSVQFNNKKEEAKCSFNSVYSIQLEKEHLEEKAKELVEIIKEYSIEVVRLEDINANLLNQFNNLKRNYEEIMQVNYDMDEAFKSVNKDYQLTKEENTGLNERINHYDTVIAKLTNENKELLVNNEECNAEIKRKEVEITQTNNLSQSFSLKINNDLIAIANWIDSYFMIPNQVNPVNDEHNITIPTITIESKLGAFDIMIKAIEAVRERNNDEREKVGLRLMTLKKESNERDNEKNKHNSEWFECLETIKRLKSDNELLMQDNKDLSTTNNNKESMINELNRKISLLNKQNEVINRVTKTTMLKMIERLNDSNRAKGKTSIPIIDDSEDIEAIFDCLLSELKEVGLFVDNKIGQEDQLSAQVKNDMKGLEKKYNALVTEVELKQIQIQKQEEIINRRQQSTLVDKDIIKRLQIEKEKLLQDNISLINKNAKLSGRCSANDSMI